MNAPAVARVIEDAINQRSGCCVLYLHHGQWSARCVYPVSCRKSRDGFLSVFGFDSLRCEWRSFRLDRIEDAHPLTFPPGRDPPGERANQ